MSYNQSTIIGNLTKDPTLVKIKDDLYLCKFSVAQSETFKCKDGSKKSHTEYFNIECWGPFAKVCDQFLSKGSSVFVSGKSLTSKYDKKNGETGTYHYINANSIKFLSPKKTNKANDTSANSWQSVDTSSETTHIEENLIDEGLIHTIEPDFYITTEEIPF